MAFIGITYSTRYGTSMPTLAFAGGCGAVVAPSIKALVTGMVLQFAGFEPNVEQTEEAQLAIRGIFSVLPASCYVIGAILFARFRFNEREHTRVRAALNARAG